MAQLAQAKIQEASTSALSNLLSSYKANMSGTGSSSMFASLLNEAGASMPVVQPYDPAANAAAVKTPAKKAGAEETPRGYAQDSNERVSDPTSNTSVKAEPQDKPTQDKAAASDKAAAQDDKAVAQKEPADEGVQKAKEDEPEATVGAEEASEDRALAQTEADETIAEDASLDDQIAALIAALGVQDAVKVQAKTEKTAQPEGEQLEGDQAQEQLAALADQPSAALAASDEAPHEKVKQATDMGQHVQQATKTEAALSLAEQSKAGGQQRDVLGEGDEAVVEEDSETLSHYTKMIEEATNQTSAANKGAGQKGASDYADLMNGQNAAQPKADNALAANAATAGVATTQSVESLTESAVQSAGGKTTQSVTGIAGGARPVGSYDFASQLSAARVTKGGNAGLPQAVEQVAVQLHKAVKDGANEITIQLRPAELGKIEVKLEITADKSVTGTVVADNQATLNMLQKDSSSLQRALQEAGLQADAGCMQFSLRDEGQAHQFTQNQNEGQGAKFKTDVVAHDDGTDDLPPPTATETYYVTPGRVNLRV